MAVGTPRWPLIAASLLAVLAVIAPREAWAEGVRASDAVDAINSGRQQFLQGLRGALAAVAKQKDNLVEELLADVEDMEDDEEGMEAKMEEQMEEELGLLSDAPDVKTIDIRLPDAVIDASVPISCTATSLTDAQQHIVGFSPLINQDDVVHIALYGCPDQAANKQDYWSCSPRNKSGICQGPTALMYEWTRDRCDDYLAKGEAITVGGAFIHNVVLMVQYNEGGFSDSSGIALKLMPSSANEKGILETVQYYSAALRNPSCNPVSSADSASSKSDEVAEEDDDNDDDAEEGNDNDVALSSSSASVAIEEPIGSEFSAMSYLQSILEANSEWMSSNQQPRIDYGVDGSAPMSSYAQYGEPQSSYMDNALDGQSAFASSDEWMMRLQDLWNSANELTYGMTLRGWWPRNDEREIGQVAGVATDSNGKLALLHRGNRPWSSKSFDDDNNFLPTDPIAEPLVLTLDPESGDILSEWGSDLFYMPHGLYIDAEDNMWITDVGLHQVFKFPAGSREPSLTLGKRLVKGSDAEHFCKPTDVAVDSRTGEFFVADGYCNHRVLKYRANGTLMMEITAGAVPGEFLPPSSPMRSFQVPHSLALIESRDIVCVADRENARIQCFNVTSGQLERQIASPMFGDQLFAISYNAEDDVLYAVNGPNEVLDVPPLAFTLDLDTGDILSTWDPYPKAFGVVHDIATYAPEGAVYLGDIGLNRVWKFETTSSSLANEI